IFAFLSCPLLAQGTGRKNVALKIKGPWLHSLFSFLSHGRCFSQERISSITGVEVKGYFFNCLNKSSLLDRLSQIEAFSLKNGAGILGVDLAADFLAHKWDAVCAKMKIPVTTGNALVAWSAHEAIYRMARLKHIELKCASLAVIGISHPAAALCSKKFSGLVRSLVIFDYDRDKLKRLYDKILKSAPRNAPVMASSVSEAVKGCDIVLSGGNLQDENLYPEAINPGGIICNILAPGMSIGKKNSFRGSSVINAGLIKLPRVNNFRLIPGLAPNILFASMAETMLLTLEQKFADYSGNEDTNIEKMEEIADIAARHGFEVWVPEAPLDL
ncbi:MAG: hypothetical protein NT033_04895, partial [Candidatus Omnitrophica bacterium]|nr:hypothetical protein [Candidatus Omnitrophota bacterium]